MPLKTMCRVRKKIALQKHLYIFGLLTYFMSPQLYQKCQGHFRCSPFPGTVADAVCSHTILTEYKWNPGMWSQPGDYVQAAQAL